MNIHEVIQRPLITEKSSIGREEENVVTLAVHPKANKHDIRRAVEGLFDVQVLHATADGRLQPGVTDVQRVDLSGVGAHPVGETRKDRTLDLGDCGGIVGESRHQLFGPIIQRAENRATLSPSSS